MEALGKVLLVLTLVLCGGYAGLMLMCQIGVLPAFRRLSPNAFADAWRAMDAYMDRSMPPYKIGLLLINAAAYIKLAIQHHPALAAATGCSFLLSLLGLVLTVRQQLPLNAQLKNLPAGTPDHVLLEIRDRTIDNFRVRFVLSTAAFVILCLGVVVWPVR